MDSESTQQVQQEAPRTPVSAQKGAMSETDCGWLYIWHASGFTVRLAKDGEINDFVEKAKDGTSVEDLQKGRGDFERTGCNLCVLVVGKAGTAKEDLFGNSGSVRRRMYDEKQAYAKLFNVEVVPITIAKLKTLEAVRSELRAGGSCKDLCGLTWQDAVSGCDHAIFDTERFFQSLAGLPLPSRFLSAIQVDVETESNSSISSGNLKFSEVIVADSALPDLIRGHFLRDNSAAGLSISSLVRELSGTYMLIADVPLILEVPNSRLSDMQKLRFLRAVVRVRISDIKN